MGRLARKKLVNHWGCKILDKKIKFLGNFLLDQKDVFWLEITMHDLIFLEDAEPF